MRSSIDWRWSEISLKDHQFLAAVLFFSPSPVLAVEETQMSLDLETPCRLHLLHEEEDVL